MGLTFRTGSGGKGSALTIEELDNNFRYFTGSHSITGSLDIDGNITASGNISSSGTIIANSASISKIVDGPDSNANAAITIITSDDTSLEFSDTIVGSTDEYDLTLTSGGAIVVNRNGSNFSGSAGNITASANISSSGTITGNLIQVDDLGYNFTNHSMRIVPSTTGVLTFSGVTSAKFEGNITASANVSASGDIFGQTGSFAGGLVLTSPNGTQYRFTTNNDGHLSLTGSVI